MNTLDQPAAAEYQPASQAHFGKNGSAVYSFESPHTIAKQHALPTAAPMVQAGGAPATSIPQAPALPRMHMQQRQPIRLRTRNWTNTPWQGRSIDSHYTPPNSFLSSTPTTYGSIPTYLNNTTNKTWRTSQNISSSAAPALLGVYNDIPASHTYQPANIPSNFSLSKNPYDIKPGEEVRPNYPINQSIAAASIPAAASLAKPGERALTNIPVPPTLPHRRGWRRTYKPIRLRTRNWGLRTGNGWTGFDGTGIRDESFLKYRALPIPIAPRGPTLMRQRRWLRGPYKQRPLRTRSWGQRSINGWSGFNRGIYENESLLPFNQRRSLQDNNAQAFNSLPTNTTIINTTNQVPTLVPVAAAPVGGFPLLKGRRARRAARKAAKQQAIQNQLQARVNPPIGDPAVNHYRRGAPVAVPLVGPAPAGIEPANGGILGRRIGRRNNRGARRRHGGWIPAPAQAPVAAPVYRTMPSSAVPLASAGAVPLTQQYAQQPLGSSYGSVPLTQQYQQPITGTTTTTNITHPPVIASSLPQQQQQRGALYSSAGIPLSSSALQQNQQQSLLQQSAPLYTGALSSNAPLAQSAPLYTGNLSSAAGIPLSAGTTTQQPILEKKASDLVHPPSYTRPIGSATL